MRQDYAKARNYWEEAANEGLLASQMHLGALYEEGKGVKPDPATARKWYDRACEQGYEEGCERSARLAGKR